MYLSNFQSHHNGVPRLKLCRQPNGSSALLTFQSGFINTWLGGGIVHACKDHSLMVASPQRWSQSVNPWPSSWCDAEAKKVYARMLRFQDNKIVSNVSLILPSVFSFYHNSTSRTSVEPYIAHIELIWEKWSPNRIFFPGNCKSGSKWTLQENNLKTVSSVLSAHRENIFKVQSMFERGKKSNWSTRMQGILQS